MNEQETDQCNGTTYIIPIQPRDFDNFADKTYLYTTFFTVRPDIIGNSNRNYCERTNLLEGVNWNIGNWTFNNRGALGSNPTLVIGGIPYAIDKFLIKDLSKEEQGLLNVPGLIIFGEIGEAHLSASRETLQYDETTIKYVKHRLRQVYREIPDLASQLISDCPTLWEASINVKELNSRINVSGIDYKWHGKSVPARFDLPKEVKISSYGGDRRRTVTGSIYPNRQDVLVYNDLSHINRLERIDIIKTQNVGKDVKVLSVPKGYVLSEDVFPLTDLGVILLSSIEYTPPIKQKVVQQSNGLKVVNRKPKGTTPAYLYTFGNRTAAADGDKTKGMFSYFSPLFIDVEQESGVYVSIKGGQLGPESGIEKVSSFISPYDCPSYISLVTTVLGIKKLYAFAPSDCEALGTDWVTLECAVTKYLLDNRNTPAMLSYLNRQFVYNEKLPSFGTLLDELDSQHIIVQYFNKSVELDWRKPEYQAITELLHKHCNTITEAKIEDGTLSMMYDSVCNRYPMFISLVRECYKGSFERTHGRNVIDYIKIVDRK
jgi:hypothetical protein